jgi:hypothetical protein
VERSIAKSTDFLAEVQREEDMDLFYAATSITIGDGKKSQFWEAPWLDIAPLVFVSSKRKKKSGACLKPYMRMLGLARLHGRELLFGACTSIH